MNEEEALRWVENRLKKLGVPLTTPEVYDLLYGGTDVDEEFKLLLEEETE